MLRQRNVPALLGAVGDDLPGGEDGEAHALLGQHRQHPLVDGGLRQPHALGFAPEPVAEVGQAPAHLGAQVAVVAQRQDRVLVGLGDAPVSRPVGLDDARVDPRVVLEPRQQRRPDVERQPPVVVDDGDDAAVVVEDAGSAVGPVALGRDALVPVVEGRRQAADGLGPGVLARGGW